MKIPWTFVALMAVNTLLATTTPNDVEREKNSTRWTIKTETLVKERVSFLNLPFSVSSDPAVMKYIKRYVTYGKIETAKIIGRSKLYFPIFEHHLRLNHLPLELKYLPMIESDLKPLSRSNAGAVGLWQFIRPTARLYGIKMNRKIDERYDPYRSTEAATRLLERLYTEYCDWAIVLAAYNCGNVKVNKAIALSGSKNYDQIKMHLPTETRHYVARFVAAAYIVKYYGNHGIQPVKPDYGFKDVRALKIFQSITFDQIEKITMLDQATIHLLNPSYLTGNVPASKRGNYIMLPERAIRAISRYLRDSRKASEETAFLPQNAFEKWHQVKVGQSIHSIAERYGCTQSEIMVWNGLPNSTISAGQELILFFKPEVRWRDRA